MTANVAFNHRCFKKAALSYQCLLRGSCSAIPEASLKVRSGPEVEFVHQSYPPSKHRLYTPAQTLEHKWPLSPDLRKNRLALLRLVCCWLVLARMVRCVRVVLPPRISAFVANVLFKMEAATGYLLKAFGYSCRHGSDHIFWAAAMRHHAGQALFEAVFWCAFKALFAAINGVLLNVSTAPTKHLAERIRASCRHDLIIANHYHCWLL
ncbi:hypothetical protein GQR58_017964 [Nymphon striatum]|nr:hypothetical protein GQR58_017964 [Nymphon striatum]